MENEQEKQSQSQSQSPHKSPYTQLERDRTFTTFTLESESESDTSYDNDDNANFCFNQEFDTNLQFLESEGSNDDDEGIEEDDEIDVDELTYEELILLGDFIGQEKRGSLKSEVPSCLHSYTYNSTENKNGIDRCVICQVEFEEGDTVVAIQCEHPYHKECISKWLQIKKACPVCSSEI